jgi:hypothetical protein
MIGTVRHHRYPPLVSRASARHRDPLSPPQSMGTTLARMDPPTIPTMPLPSTIRQLRPSGGVDRPAIIHLRTKRPG